MKHRIEWFWLAYVKNEDTVVKQCYECVRVAA